MPLSVLCNSCHLSLLGISYTVVPVSSITTSGSVTVSSDSKYTYFTYTGNGTINFPSSSSTQVLIVGGGGGGGRSAVNDDGAGGGGAGGVGYGTITFLPNTPYTISVGTGGASDTVGKNTTIIGVSINEKAYGGAFGAGLYNPVDGGSGGGGSPVAPQGNPSNATKGAGTLNYLGNNGGGSNNYYGSRGSGGGGGGAGAVGSSVDGSGGNGFTWSVNGLTYAGGGGGGNSNTLVLAPGGSGGGGNGGGKGAGSAYVAGNGTFYGGGGGGGSWSTLGGTGYQGVVIIALLK